MPADPTALDLDQVRTELEHETPNYLDPAGPWKTMKRMSQEEMLHIIDLAIRATAAESERDRLREENERLRKCSNCSRPLWSHCSVCEPRKP